MGIDYKIIIIFDIYKEYVGEWWGVEDEVSDSLSLNID